ncbi:tyrosine-type recombinase/integrase [Marinagarivorans cellulosilyticus]|uniref:Integrase/recombinase XerD n=1 Tax=Marinagarivorans cellulosilyticus TaxID=2721545 RepID=A0AAN1WJU5_9GAMM|nr:tyrosine-type recombinase/integrase [Marinagarivorans cellulosilyticus]BCD98847.1 integrase/recombinase XerD [Marinagarivorans cellulosilyticus]
MNDTAELLHEGIECYLTYCESHAQSLTTILNKKRMLFYFASWCEQEQLTLLAQIGMVEFERYSLYLCRYRKALDGEPLAHSTRRLRLTAVRECFRRLYCMGILPAHSLAKFELPRVPKSLPKAVFTLEDIEMIIDQVPEYGAKGLRDKALLEVLFATGIRTAELARLNVVDVDMARKLLSVSKGKGKKDRVVPIAERTVLALENYLHLSRPRLLKFEATDALLVSNRGKPYRPEQMSRLVSQYIQRSGTLKLGSCRKFRHAAATLMLENGADIRVIQELLGHEDITTTQIYTRVSPDLLIKTYQATHPAALYGVK